MDNAWNGYAVEGLNMAVLIVASCYLGVQFIWLTIGTCLFCKKRESACHKCHAIVMSISFFAMGISIVVMTSILLAGINSRVVPLSNWHAYAECVDEYMQINDYQA